MLWLCLHFPHLPAEALGLRDPLAVVTEQRGAQRWLITDAPGIAGGMPLGLALSIQPALRAQPRRAAAERAMLLQLAQGLYRYGSPVCAEIREAADVGRTPQALLWIEIGASLQLFGGAQALCAAIRADLDELEHRVQLALAPTRAAAALFAVQQQRGVAAPQGLDAALTPLPIDVLPWPTATLAALHGVGLKTIGQLLALPRAAFARRFGPSTLRELDQLRGRAAEPSAAIVPPTLFKRRFELPGEVETVEALSFALKRLTLELQHWLRARDLGVRALRLVCEHAQRRRSSFTLRYGTSHRDARRLFDTLHERIGREPLAAAVRAIRLEAIDTAAADVVQHDLFNAGDGGLQWRASLERIAARLGDAAVWTPVPIDEHRPERAAHARRLMDVADEVGTAPMSHRARSQGLRGQRAAHIASLQCEPERASARPLWLLREPQVLHAPPPADTAPERIESGWWDHADARRDYYRLQLADASAWVFCEHGSQRWFVHGFWG